MAKRTHQAVSYKQTIEECSIFKHRHTSMHRLKMGATRDGKVIAVDHLHRFDNGAYGYKPYSFEFHIDNFSNAGVDFKEEGVHTNLPMCACIRGVGSVPANAAIGETGDILAEKLNIDPITFWKNNHYRAGDLIRTLGIPPRPLSSEAYDQMMDTGAAGINWNDKWKGWGKPYHADGSKRRAVGMALGTHMSGVPNFPIGAEIQIHGGTASVGIAFVDMGMDNSLMFCQVAADTLGFKLEDVQMAQQVNTQSFPFAYGTGGSSSAYIGTQSVHLAAEDAKQKILMLASNAPFSPNTMGQPIENLDIKDSVIFVKDDPEKCISVGEISFFFPSIVGLSIHHFLDVAPRAPQHSVVFADIEVDTETGIIEVLKLHVNQDSGRIINPDGAENNIMGAAAMFLGYGLMEEVLFDPKTGTMLNKGLSNYFIPTALDMPEVDVEFAQDIDPGHSQGTKAMGEAPIAVHQAIRAALYNATGARIRSFPLTPDNVLTALGQID